MLPRRQLNGSPMRSVPASHAIEQLAPLASICRPQLPRFPKAGSVPTGFRQGDAWHVWFPPVRLPRKHLYGVPANVYPTLQRIEQLLPLLIVEFVHEPRSPNIGGDVNTGFAQ